MINPNQYRTIGITPEEFEKSRTAGQKEIQAVVDAAKKPFELVNWIIENWKLAAVAAVALVILLKD